MANKTILMTRIRQILRIYIQGESKKQISQLTSSSRNSINKYIHKFILEQLTLPVHKHPLNTSYRYST
jgi:hypothetical protein